MYMYFRPTYPKPMPSPQALQTASHVRPLCGQPGPLHLVCLLIGGGPDSDLNTFRTRPECYRI